jgi:hypothetical protein
LGRWARSRFNEAVIAGEASSPATIGGRPGKPTKPYLPGDFASGLNWKRRRAALGARIVPQLDLVVVVTAGYYQARTTARARFRVAYVSARWRVRAQPPTQLPVAFASLASRAAGDIGDADGIGVVGDVRGDMVLRATERCFGFYCQFHIRPLGDRRY